MRRWIYITLAAAVGVLLAVLGQSSRFSGKAIASSAAQAPDHAGDGDLVRPASFIREKADVKINNVPGSPGYDPTKFRGILRISEVFGQEPRNPTWAAPVEKWLSQHMAADLKQLAPEISNLAVECRTSSCRITWDGPREALMKVREVHAALYPGTARTAMTANELIMVYGGGFLSEMKKPEQLIAFWKDNRAENLKRAATDTSPLHKIPTELWPKE